MKSCLRRFVLCACPALSAGILRLLSRLKTPVYFGRSLSNVPAGSLVVFPLQRTLLGCGIAEHYTPESLIGRQVIVVANLKPAKLMGVVSQGMLLAAGEAAGPVLVLPDKTVTPGTPLK